MASSQALKRPFTSSMLFTRALRPACPFTTTTFPLFRAAANAVPVFEEDDDEGGDSSVRAGFDVDLRSGRSPYMRCVLSPFSDAFVPFYIKSLSQAPNMADQPAGKAAFRAPYSTRDTEDGLQLRFELPGLGKEDVKVSVEQSTLVVSVGEGKKEAEGDGDGTRVHVKLDLGEKVYKLKEIKAEMKNGVLKVMVPKLTKEEMGEVIHVNVE